MPPEGVVRIYQLEAFEVSEKEGLSKSSELWQIRQESDVDRILNSGGFADKLAHLSGGRG